MKKYQQLLLLITSVISLALVLVYRNEYNRLHYVLEVFNFFGKPCNLTDLELTENVITHHDWGVEPIWQEVEESYVYSAFWNANGGRALVLHTERSQIFKNCYLWFESLEKPKKGSFKSVAQDKDDVNLQRKFEYFCSLGKLEKPPYAVSFTTKSKPPPSSLKKIMFSFVKGDRKEFPLTVCSYLNTFTKSSFVEFLSFHKVIGVNNFLFYGDISHRLNKIVTNLSNRLGISVTFLEFNYPKSDGSLLRKFIEEDCLLRTMHVSKNVLVLDVNEYLVPHKHFSLSDLIDYYSSDKILGNFSLPVQKFCIDSANQGKPIALQNTESHYDDSNLVRFIYVNSDKSGNNINNNDVDAVKPLVNIHKYVKCSEKPKRVFHDTTILKYYVDFIRSTLVQLNTHDQL